MLKKDQKNAYKYVPVRPEDWPLQVFRWLGRYFVELCIIFGASSAVGAFDRFHQRLLQDLVLPLCSIPRHLVLRCLDDVPVIAPPGSSWLEEFDRAYSWRCKQVNVELAPNSPDADKAFVDVTRGTIFGVTYDTVSWTWSFPEDKRLRLYHDISDLAALNEAPLSTIDSVVGKIQDFSVLLPFGRFLKSHILALLDPMVLDRSTLAPIPREASADLSWWALMVRFSADGFPIMEVVRHPPLNCLRYTSDAAGTSVLQEDQTFDKGAASLRLATKDLPFFAAVVRWPFNIQVGALAPDGKSMAHKTTTLELVGVMLPFLTDLHAMAGRPVLCETDNVGAVCTWWRGHSNTDPLASTLVRALAPVLLRLGLEEVFGQAI